MTELSAHHVGVTVADLEQAVEFYQDTLGFPVENEFSISGEAFETAVDVEDATGRFAHLDAGGVRVELVEYGPEGEPQTTSSVNCPGAKHLGFSVDDVDSLYESLEGDVEMLSEPQTTETGSRILFVRDPEGNLVELLETS
ncbi:lactoylglutathione lyase-like lyase [Halogeometricum pallidum JCM 14848]|uniref:Lactoylglutathione lyase-like lyase n=1 Tax=Halogeometricum pallidum JCM 14848 TaxID=1227487 RepID=M0D2N4_HALPD|nr:VOC family protein [Halogeometricum pallidum]ELZ28414.1 lactoylglutathione lyase-like lyase [Halogeometricum pallidum JCM 14848]